MTFLYEIFYGRVSFFVQNRAPVLDNASPDQTFSGPGVLSYTVPADTFQDLDHDPLTYRATLSSGAALTAWLTFDAATRTFRGNPEPGDASPLQIRVTDTDPYTNTISDDFHLTLVNIDDNTAPPPDDHPDPGGRDRERG